MHRLRRAGARVAGARAGADRRRGREGGAGRRVDGESPRLDRRGLRRRHAGRRAGAGEHLREPRRAGLHPSPQRCVAVADAAVAAPARLSRRPARGARGDRGGGRGAHPLPGAAAAAPGRLPRDRRSARGRRDVGRPARHGERRSRRAARRRGGRGRTLGRRRADLHLGHDGESQGRAAHPARGNPAELALRGHPAARARRPHLHDLPLLLDGGHRHVDRADVRERCEAAAPGDLRGGSRPRLDRVAARDGGPRLAAPAEGHGRAPLGEWARPDVPAQDRLLLAAGQARGRGEGRVRNRSLLRTVRDLHHRQHAAGRRARRAAALDQRPCAPGHGAAHRRSRDGSAAAGGPGG